MEYRLIAGPLRLEQPTLAVVRSAVAFQPLWEAAFAKQFDHRHPGRPMVPPTPPIDWATEIVVVAALGARSNGCYGVYLSLSEELDCLHVLVHEQTPAPDWVCTAAITHPTMLAIVRTEAGGVVFHVPPPAPGYQPTAEQERKMGEAFERWLDEHPEARQPDPN
ncbi:MAG TPA: hypothetical protein VGJ28_19990 [Micromonosporaceae bacterium]|jgi:hypothetical protein